MSVRTEELTEEKTQGPGLKSHMYLSEELGFHFKSQGVTLKFINSGEFLKVLF